MTNRQRAKFDSYQRVASFNRKYSAAIDTIPEYAAEQLIFNSNLAIIESAGVVQQQTSTPYSKAAIDSKEKLATVINQFALRGRVKAVQLKNLTLAAQLNQPVSYIIRATKTEAISRAENLRNLLNNNMPTLTNITAADIAVMDAAITAYDEAKNHPIETRQAKKAEGTDVLPAAYIAMDTAISNMYDLVYSYFLVSNPVLVDDFSLAMELIDTGIRHNITDFVILAQETGNVLEGATITDASNGDSYTTDENGQVRIDRHQSGHFNFTIAANNRQSVLFGADIKKGTHSYFTVQLKLV